MKVTEMARVELAVSSTLDSLNVKIKGVHQHAKGRLGMATTITNAEPERRERASATRHVIVKLAQQYGASYTPAVADTWAQDVTRLSGDDVVLDEIELLLIALQRAGHLSRKEALCLQVNYLREARQ